MTAQRTEPCFDMKSESVYFDMRIIVCRGKKNQKVDCHVRKIM